MWKSNVAKGTLGRATTDGEVEELGERYFGLALGVSRGCGCVDNVWCVSAGQAVEAGGRGVLIVVEQAVGRQSKGQGGVCYLGLGRRVRTLEDNGAPETNLVGLERKRRRSIAVIYRRGKNQVKVRPRSSAINWYNAWAEKSGLGGSRHRRGGVWCRVRPGEGFSILLLEGRYV